MALHHWCDVIAALVTLLVLILVDDSDYLLLRKVEIITFATDVECGSLHRSRTMDDKAHLQIVQIIIVCFVNEGV